MKKGGQDRGPTVSMNKMQNGIVCLVFLIMSIPSPAHSQAEWKGTVVKEGDVTIVRNPKEPLYKTPVLELKEDLSLGGPEARGDYAFGNGIRFVVDEEASIYVLDTQDAHIKVFDKTGKYVRTIGRKGQGPGELDSPWTLTVNRVAGELAVLQLARRMSYFKTDGTFLRHQSINDSSSAKFDSRGNIYTREKVRSKNGEWSLEVKKLSMFGFVLGVLASSPGQGYSGKINPFFAVNVFQVDKSSNLVYGDPRTYELLLFSASEGKPYKKITREYDPVTVTDEDKAEELKKTPTQVQASLVFPKYYPAYEHFFLTDLGHVFVKTWEKTKDGKRLYDIFDAEGRFIDRIPLKPSGIEILNGKYYALEEDEDGYQYVKRYTVSWNIK
jgi:hypothetical protein